MNLPSCCHCLTPLSRRELLFDSLLCVVCEQKLTAYRGPLPDPNLAFTEFGSPTKRNERQSGEHLAIKAL